jgi:hypothetical protein
MRSAATSDCASPAAVTASNADKISASAKADIGKNSRLKLEFMCHAHHIDLYMMRLSIDAGFALLLHKCHIATQERCFYKNHLI